MITGIKRSCHRARNGVLLSIVGATVVCGITAFADERPSVCVRRAELTALRDKTLLPGLSSVIWAEVLAAAEQAVARPVITIDEETDREFSMSRNARMAARNMELMALAYLVTREDRFAERARETALEAASASSWIDPDSRDTFRAAARGRYAGADIPQFHYTDAVTGDLARGVGLVYDWLFDYLSSADRERLRSATIEKGIRPVIDDMGGGIWWAERRHTRGVVAMSGIGIAALSFFDEEPAAARWVSEAKRWIAEYFSHQGSDGGCADGFAAWNDGVGSALIFMEALRTRLNDTDLYRHPYLLNTGEFALYSTMPDKLGVVNFGRCPYGTAHRGTWLMWRLASQLRDGMLQWNATEIWRAARRRPAGGNPYRDWYRSHWDFIWHDPDVETRNPQAYPTAKHFRGTDWAILRSGWTDKDILLAIRSDAGSGPWLVPDVNNIVMTAYGRPVLVSRYPTAAAPHTGMYNCVLIDGNGRNVPAEVMWPQPGTDRRAAGAILEFRQERGYDYVLAEAGGAYGESVERLYRHVLFVEPDYVVVIDDIVADEPVLVEQRWHTVGRIETGDSVATMYSGNVTLRVEPIAVVGQPLEFEVCTDIDSADDSQYGIEAEEPMPYLRVGCTRAVDRYTCVTVLTPGLQRPRSYHPVVEGGIDAFTVKVKRSQWRDTIECKRQDDRLAVTVDFEPALKLPTVPASQPPIPLGTER